MGRKKQKVNVDMPTDGKGNYIYEAIEISNYDGDTFGLTIRKAWDLGFKIRVIQELKIKTRIQGVDTPELRDKRPDFKAAGYLAKEEARKWVNERGALFVSTSKPDKYGRALGDFMDADGNYLTEFLIEKNLAVKYEGQNKADVQSAHKINIAKLKKAKLI